MNEFYFIIYSPLSSTYLFFYHNIHLIPDEKLKNFNEIELMQDCLIL